MMSDRADALLVRAKVALDAGDAVSALRMAAESLALEPLNAAAAELVTVARRNLDVAGRGEGEWRRLSVLFCDVVGSTRLAAQLKAERYRELLLLIQRVCANAAIEYEGRIAQYLGDGVLAYFSYPQAHEDDPARAVRAGLQILDSLAAESVALQTIAGEPVAVRIGIDTGLVVVGELGGGAWRTSDSVVGDPPNVASRIQELAGRNQLLISGSTARDVAHSFSLRSLGSATLKNYPHPVEVFSVEGTTDPAERSGEPLTPRTPLVGRLAEVDRLVEAWSQVVAGTPTPPVLLTGDAGIGKTRLVEHLANVVAASGGRRIELRCSEMFRNSAFQPISGPLRRLLGIAETAGLEAVNDDAIAEGLKRLPGRTIEDAKALPALRHLLGIARPSTVLPDELREQLLTVLTDIFDAAASLGPLLLVLENAHDADPSTLELFGRIRAACQQPYLAVVTSRSPASPNPEGFIHLPITRLDDESCCTIVRAVAADLSNEMVRDLAIRSGGVPLFAEELARSVHLGAKPEDLPEALQGIFVSRLDRLDPGARRLAADMAVVGDESSRDLLLDLHMDSADSLDRSLGLLIGASMVQENAAPGAESFRFRHALIRDALYTAQLTEQKRQRHRRVAAALESRYNAGRQVRPEEVAHHLSAGGERAQAIGWWHRAASHAAESASHLEAITHFEQALAHVDALPVEQGAAIELALQLGVGLSRSTAYGYSHEAALDAFERAESLYSLADTSSFSVAEQTPILWGLWSFQLVRGNHSRSAPLAARMTALAAASGTDDDRALVACFDGFQAFYLGHFEASREKLTLGSSTSPTAGLMLPQDAASASLASLAIADLVVGEDEQAKHHLEQAIRMADLLTDHRAFFTQAFVACYAAWANQLSGDWPAAESHARRAIELSTEHSFTIWQLAGYLHLAAARARQGHVEESLGVMSATLDIWRKQAGAELMSPYYLSQLADMQLHAGAPHLAMEALDEALSLTELTLERFWNAELLRLRAQARLARGDPYEDVRADLERAVDVAAGQGARLLELRCLLDLNELAGGSDGDRAAWAHRLERHLEHWSGRPGPAEARRARAMLATGLEESGVR